MPKPPDLNLAARTPKIGPSALTPGDCADSSLES